MDTLNGFQRDTLDKLQRTLKERQIASSDVIVGGPVEFGIKVSFCGYELWIYKDGASVLGADLDRRFEIYDYHSLKELQTALLAFLKDLRLDAAQT